ncbi:MAG: lysine--tRNA ligase [Alphaproteobacteria bacterium]|nr:lysine--tRNA ligase [Alphaproteobacteria bacterium]
MVDSTLAATARAWPFEEARKLLVRLGGGDAKHAPAKGHVLFETGYGPSGLPHLGTFGEVARTSMVRRAFQELSGLPTRLVAFSDDMDGLRKVPDNVPNRAAMAAFLDRPLTQVPDPFGTHDSFGAHNNARLRAFLDRFGFAYEFLSATECYRSGRFDPTLLQVLQHLEDIAAVVLPELGAERRATYCPFLPISPKSGKVLQTPPLEVRKAQGTLVFADEDGSKFETPVTGGACKLQWRVDWAMRWAAFGVDYEMSGKDLIDSVRLSSRICKLLGGRPPESMTYEHFLDENGEKISKSKGNGMTIEQWLTYGPPESLALFMFHKPKAAKRLHFDVIPRAVDDYLDFLAKFATEDAAARLENPAWHIHAGTPPASDMPVSFGLLLNLVSVCHTDNKSVLWGFLKRFAKTADAASHPLLDRLLDHALAYYRDFVKPTRQFRAPTEVERAALIELAAKLETLPDDATGEAIQFELYEIGKRHPFPSLRDWFKALYEILLGQSQGPRFGSFVALYGRAETLALIRRALAGEDLATDERAS